MHNSKDKKIKGKSKLFLFILIASILIFMVIGITSTSAYESEFGVDPNVTGFNSSDGSSQPGVSVVDVTVITSWLFNLSVTTEIDATCSYNRLTLDQSIIEFSYANATADGNGNTITNGSLDGASTSHSRILNNTQDEEYIRYGFYCTNTTADAYSDLIFTIDTTPPNITLNAVASEPIVIFEDDIGRITDDNNMPSDGIIFSSSSSLSMYFDTDELGVCRYDVTNTSNSSISYNSMTNTIDPSGDSISHNATITPPLGQRIYYHIGCQDAYGNFDNVGQVQTPYNNIGLMFILDNPNCEDLNVTANDTPSDDGGSVTITWEECGTACTSNDYITRYEIFRVASSVANSNAMTKTDLYASHSTYWLGNVTDDGSTDFTFIDNTAVDGSNYYYYVLARYYNNTIPNAMDNIVLNMSCVLGSNRTNSTDNGYPDGITGLSAIRNMNDINGASLILNWTISADDGNNSNDVSNYTVFRQIYNTGFETLGIYDLINGSLTAGTSQYKDTGLSSNNTYCYIVMVSDISNLSTNSTKLCVQPNSRPYYINITETPAIAATGDNITCTAFITDVDGDDLSSSTNFTWEIFHVSTFETTTVVINGTCTPPVAPGLFQAHNFTNYTTECLANLSSIYFNKGDKVWCSLNSSDDLEEAVDQSTNLTFIRSTYLPINNTAPSASAVNISPAAPNGSSNLYCNYTFNDVDGDAENTSLAEFKWYINNEGLNSYIEILGQIAQTLSNKYIDQNDLVICSVKPYDVDNTWINNPLAATNYANSSAVTVTDNSVPQIINFSAVPFDDVTQAYTIVGSDVLFRVDWLDVDTDEQGQMYVCDQFSTSENQAAANYDTYVHFGDNTSNDNISTIFYTNQTGKYVNQILIKPYKFERNGYYVYGDNTKVEAGDYDLVNGNLNDFPTNLTYYDKDHSGIYSRGEAIINDTDINGIYNPAVDIIVRGEQPPTLATLVNLSRNTQRYYDVHSDGSYNATVDYIYYDADDDVDISADDIRLEIFAQDNLSNIYYTNPIYDMYVYEVDNAGNAIAGKTLIAQDNNNWFVLGDYNNFTPQYNAQPLPNKILAFVLCIDMDDDTTCDSNMNNNNDAVYIRASDTVPGSGNYYLVNDSSKSAGDVNPEIKINYASNDNGGCLTKSYCNTSLSTETAISCQYTVPSTDNQTQSYAVRVCDDESACSAVRTGSFVINHVPDMLGVYIGNDSNSSMVGTDSNLMCMHIGATDEAVNTSDFVLDADGNITIFGDVRNYKDVGLDNNDTLVPFSNGIVYDLNLTFDGTKYENGFDINDSTYDVQLDALVIDMNDDSTYQAATDVVIFNPRNSLREGDYLNSTLGGNLSFFDANNDGYYTFNSTYPEDIIFNTFSYQTSVYNEEINFSFLWYVMPAGTGEFKPATNFTWYDNDFNDIVTHGNTMSGDQWICQVTPSDQYGYGNPMNSTTVVIGSEGASPDLAPKISGVSDDSNQTSPTTIGSFLTVSINYTDPNSEQVKAYVCNSSKIIRNSGCFEKEFNRSTYNGTINTLHIMNVTYLMASDYNMSPTNYSVMLCDPEYHCSAVWESNSSQNVTFYANNAPQHTTASPIIVTDPPRNLSYPRNYLDDANLFCNVSHLDRDNADWENNISYDITNVSFTWYRNSSGNTSTIISNIAGLQGAILSAAQTLENDTWICSAIVNDSYGGQSTIMNSSAITIGDYVAQNYILPVIENVSTNSTVLAPINYGEYVHFNVSWHSYNSPQVNIYICNSTDVNPSGCLGRTIAQVTTATSPTSIAYLIDEDDMQYFTNSSVYTMNYTILISNVLGAGNTTYSDNLSRDYDNFSINYVPYLENVTVTGTNTLICNYTFSDHDSNPTRRNSSSIYNSSNSTIITWYNLTGSGWESNTFNWSDNQVPAYITNKGESWLCEVNPYDGLAYGTKVNSSSSMVGNTNPTMDSYRIVSASTGRIITSSDPITLGENIQVEATWSDPDSTQLKMYVMNNESFATAEVYFETSGYSVNNPAIGEFNSSTLSNLTNNANLYNITNNFTFVLSDPEKNLSNWAYDQSATNLSVYINRKPEINGAVNVTKINESVVSYFICDAEVDDNDTEASYIGNTSSSTYRWYMDDGSGYKIQPSYTYQTLSMTLVSAGQKWLCEITPCDDFACGGAVNSTNYGTLTNATPTILSAGIYNYFQTASGVVTYTENTNITPTKFGERVFFNITWDDADIQSTVGESANIYVCEYNVSIATGCVNTSEWCRNVSTDGQTSCILNTSIVNLTKYNNNTLINYTIVAYDDSNNVSSYYGPYIFYVDQAPVATSVNVTPTNPVNTSVLGCDSATTDYDQNSTYNTATSTYAWYVNRSSTIQRIAINTKNLTPDFTQELDRWLCEVTPTDNYVNGTPVNSSWVMVGNLTTYADRPNITRIIDNSNSTNPIAVGSDVLFNIEWTDAQLPDETVRVIICNSSNIINNTGCIDTGYVNFNGTNTTPIIAKYTVQNKDINNNNSGTYNLPYYAMICDDSSLCSDVIAGNFSVNHISNATGVSVVQLGSGNLYCNYTFTDNSYDTYATDQSTIKWYSTNATAEYCGDGIIQTSDPQRQEQCEVGGNSLFDNCTDVSVSFIGGTLGCDLSTCLVKTNLCIPSSGPKCGDNSVNLGWEQCDGSDLGIYSSCNDIGSFTGGTLACNSDCSFDISVCTGGGASFCGNGIIEYGEECEYVGGVITGTNTKCTDFTDYFYLGGTLTCNSSCEYDMSGCVLTSTIYTDLNVSSQIIPDEAFGYDDDLVCEVRPYDGFTYGSVQLSAVYEPVNETPRLLNITAIDYTEPSVPVTNNATNPVKYNDNITINITWDDINRYKAPGEQVKVFVCNDSSATPLGCLNTSLCNISYTSDTDIACEFNTSLLNTNNTNVSYYVHIYDDNHNSSNSQEFLYVNKVPVISNYTIVTVSGNTVPIDNDNLNCTYLMYDPNNATNVTAAMNQTNAYYKWYYKRGSWSMHDNYGSRIVSNVFTEVGDEWICEITYGDGAHNATPVNTSAVIIRTKGYNLTMPNITSITITSGNAYTSNPIYSTSSSTAIYQYDNTTNVGDSVDFMINWTDVDQLDNSSENVKLFICNTTNFVDNAGCLNKTLVFLDYTNNESILTSYQTENSDDPIQNITVVLCDDSGLCSTPITTNFTINHAPGNFTPEILTYVNGSGSRIFECDYEMKYYYQNGSNDVNSSGERVVNDTIASTSIKWYLNEAGSGFSLTGDSSQSISMSLRDNDKLICSVDVLDVYGLSSGDINSTELDMATLPVIWPYSLVSNDGTYIINNTNPSLNGTLEVYGYLRNDNSANITVRSYHEYDTSFSNQSTTLNRSSTQTGTTTIYANSTNGTSYILVNRVALLQNQFALNNYLKIENHNLTYYQRYRITATPFIVQPNVYRINIDQALNTTVTPGMVVTGYTGATAEYPYGWFNTSIGMYPGLNLITIESNKSGVLGSGQSTYVYYDSATPTIQLNMNDSVYYNEQIVSFNISDDYYVNISSLVINLSNGTNDTYHFTPGTLLNLSEYIVNNSDKQGSNITCIATNISFYDCNITLNLTNLNSTTGDYELNFTVQDILNKTGEQTKAFSLSSINMSAPVTFGRPIQNSTTYNIGVYINRSDIEMIQYAVGTAPYPDEGWNNVLNSTNLSGFNLSEEAKFVDYNYNIYYDSGEAIVNSTDLYFNTTDNVTVNGTGLRPFTNGTEMFSCENIVDTYNIASNAIVNTAGTILYPAPLNSTNISLYNCNFSSEFKYFDVDYDQEYDYGEPIFNSIDSFVNDSEIIGDSLVITALTLNLNTTILNLTEDKPYRVAVRYYIDGYPIPSPWAYTNPIVYDADYNATTYSGPTAASVYDINSTHAEPETLIDVTYDNDLQFNWTVPVPQKPGEGEYILYYYYALGNEPYPYDGWNSVFEWTRVDNTTTSIELNNTIKASLVTGDMYYLTVRAMSSFGLYSQNSSSNGIVYHDKTPPTLQIIDVAGDSSSPYSLNESQNPFVVTALANENLSQCGFSLFRTPFDVNYVLTKRCNNIESDNQTYVTCNLTNMDGTVLDEGSQTFYISCLDLNQNGNTAVGSQSTLEFSFAYNYPNAPNVTNASLMIYPTLLGSPELRNYSYRNEFLACDYNWTDNDGDSISETTYSWQKNGENLPGFENGYTLNISKHEPERGTNFSCSVMIKDSTGRWSNVTYSNNVSVNNSAPSAITLVSPNNAYLNLIDLVWNYASDIDKDELSYYVVMMNKTEFGPLTVVNESGYTVNETREYSYPVSTLADGTYYWLIKTCDNSSYSNNCTNSSSTYSLVLDTTGPLVDILTPDNNSYVGGTFSVIADVNDANEPNVNVSKVWAEFYVGATLNLTLDMSLNGDGYYEVEVANNLTTNTYTLVVNANDTLNNVGASNKTVVVSSDNPILQIDWPPWTFREQYLNNSFNLNLTARNASIMNYSIYNSSETIKSNSTKFVQNLLLVDQDTFSFTDYVNLSNLRDGKYYINFSAEDSLGNTYSKTSWFAVDKTPPSNGTATYSSTAYRGANQTLKIEWFNNSLVPDDNQYGVRIAQFFYNTTTTATPPIYSAASDNYISAISTIVNDAEYNYTINGSYVNKENPYIHWFSCATDYAGNEKCSQTFTISVANKLPYLSSVITDMTLYEDIGANTTLNQSIADPENETLTFSSVVLPNGTLLYDPLDSAVRSKALGALTDGINTQLINVSEGNATLIDLAHNNSLANPGFETSYVFNDSNGTVNRNAPLNWEFINNASYDNESGLYNYSIYSQDKGAVRVSAKHYLYQEVPINSSASYSLSQYMKSESGNITGRLHVNWYTSGGVYISTSQNLSDNLVRPTLTTSWQRYNITLTPPSNAGKARIYIDTDANDSYAYVDNVIFEASSLMTYYSNQNHSKGYIRYPVAPANSTRPYINATNGTLEITLKPTWDGNNTILERHIIDASGTNSNDSFEIKASRDGNLSFKYGNVKLNTSIVNWMNETVYRLAFTWDSSSIKIYENGVQQASTTSSTVPTLGTYMYLGAAKNLSSQAGAIFDELVVFDYVKNSTEILKDNATAPVDNNTNTDGSTYTLVFLNTSIDNTVASSTYSVASLSVTSINSANHPAVRHNQRIQFIGSDGTDEIASNVVDVLVITDDNTFGANVTLYNTSGTYTLSNTIVDNTVNNITYSFINNSILHNMTAPLFAIRDSIMNMSTINNSRVFNSDAYYSTIKTSNISQDSIITNSTITDSVVTVSNVTNSTFIQDVTLTNSTVIDATIGFVNLTNVYIDPSTLINVTGNNSSINNSIVWHSTVDNSNIVNATNITYSNITNCSITTLSYGGVKSNVTIANATLLGNASKINCRLLSGSVTLNQNSTPFVFTVATGTAQPLIADIWNATPEVTQYLNSSQSVSGLTLPLYVTIIDPGLSNSMLDFVNVSWEVNYSNSTYNYNVNNLNGSNLSSANTSVSLNASYTDLNISVIVVDRYGNRVENRTTNIDYFYSTVSYECSDSIDNDGDGAVDLNDTGCSSGTDTDETDCGDGICEGGESCSYCASDCGNCDGGGGGGSSGSRISTAHCYNGRRDIDDDEEGIDCGGDCTDCRMLCDDGKLNGLEDDIDCGGVCKSCTAPPITGDDTKDQCKNGVKDNDEDGVDCGGVCSNACTTVVIPGQGDSDATCDDGVKNGNEEGVDCGGDCEACDGKGKEDKKGSNNWLFWFLLIFVIIAVLGGIGGTAYINRDRIDIRGAIYNLTSKLKSTGPKLQNKLRSMKTEALDSGQSIASATDAGLYAKQNLSSRGPISDSIIAIEKYIVDALDSGLKASKIRDILVGSAWSEPVVEVVMHKILLSGDKLEEVEKYISSQMKKGHSDEEIANKLVSEHWSREIVDLIISDVHKISKNNKNLESYMQRKLGEGKSMHEIHQILVSIGWNERYIENILKRFN